MKVILLVILILLVSCQKDKSLSPETFRSHLFLKLVKTIKFKELNYLDTGVNNLEGGIWTSIFRFQILEESREEYCLMFRKSNRIKRQDYIGSLRLVALDKEDSCINAIQAKNSATLNFVRLFQYSIEDSIDKPRKLKIRVYYKAVEDIKGQDLTWVFPLPNVTPNSFEDHSFMKSQAENVKFSSSASWSLNPGVLYTGDSDLFHNNYAVNLKPGELCLEYNKECRAEYYRCFDCPNGVEEVQGNGCFEGPNLKCRESICGTKNQPPCHLGYNLRVPIEKDKKRSDLACEQKYHNLHCQGELEVQCVGEEFICL